MSKLLTKKEIKNLMISSTKTQTDLRRWERRLLVALDDENKELCKAKIKFYSYQS